MRSPEALTNPGSKALLSVPEAIRFQVEEYGRAVYKRHALYAAAHGGRLPVVWHGERRLYIKTAGLRALIMQESAATGEH